MKNRHILRAKRITAFLFISFFFLHPSSFLYSSDCPENSDACSTGSKKLSPFVEASLRESAPPHTEGTVKKTIPPEKQAAAPAVTVFFSTAPAAQAGPAEAGGKLSSPVWVLIVIAGVAGLYFYLRGGTQKRRRK